MNAFEELLKAYRQVVFESGQKAFLIQTLEDNLKEATQKIAALEQSLAIVHEENQMLKTRGDGLTQFGGTIDRYEAAFREQRSKIEGLEQELDRTKSKLEESHALAENRLEIISDWYEKTKWIQKLADEGNLMGDVFGQHRADVINFNFGYLQGENRRLNAKIAKITAERDKLKAQLDYSSEIMTEVVEPGLSELQAENKRLQEESKRLIAESEVLAKLKEAIKDGAKDHIRLVKSTIKTTFPNVTGAEPEQIAKPWYPDDSGKWVEVPEDLMTMPDELNHQDKINIITKYNRHTKKGRVDLDPHPAHIYTWGLSATSDIRIVAYKLIKKAES